MPRIRSVDEFTVQGRHLAAVCRAARPIPDPPTVEQIWQRRIVSGALAHWLSDIGPRFLDQRARLDGDHASPSAIVFSTCLAGLSAAQELLVPSRPDVICLLHDEFLASGLRRSDPERLWHVHAWSYFWDFAQTPIEENDDFFDRARRAFPLPDGDVYWCHREGTMYGPAHGRGVDHLWAWDGREPRLLEEAFSSWAT